MILFSDIVYCWKNVVLEELRGMNPSEITWLEVVPPPNDLVIGKGQYKGPIIRRWRRRLICSYTMMTMKETTYLFLYDIGQAWLETIFDGIIIIIIVIINLWWNVLENNWLSVWYGC